MKSFEIKVNLKNKKSEDLDAAPLSYPLLSIVIPSYNRASFLPLNIAAFDQQLEKDFEVIIIDDGSTDNTIEVLRQIKYSWLRYYYICNSERGAARNFGAKVALGRYINFFDSDDLALNNHVQVIKRMISDYPSALWFALNYKYSGQRSSWHISPRKFCKMVENTLDNLAHGNFLSLNGIVMQKNFFLKFKFLETRELSGSEDYELWLRLASEQSPVPCGEVTSVITDHEHRSMVTTTYSGACNRLRALSIYTRLGLKRAGAPSFDMACFEANLQLYLGCTAIKTKRRAQALRHLWAAVITYGRVVFTRGCVFIIRGILLR